MFEKYLTRVSLWTSTLKGLQILNLNFNLIERYNKTLLGRALYSLKSLGILYVKGHLRNRAPSYEKYRARFLWVDFRHSWIRVLSSLMPLQVNSSLTMHISKLDEKPVQDNKSTMTLEMWLWPRKIMNREKVIGSFKLEIKWWCRKEKFSFF